MKMIYYIIFMNHRNILYKKNVRITEEPTICLSITYENDILYHFHESIIVKKRRLVASIRVLNRWRLPYRVIYLSLSWK